MSRNREKLHTASWPLMKRLLRQYLFPHAKKLAVAFIFMALAAGMTGGLAKLMEPIIDNAFNNTNESLLYKVAGAVLVAFIIRGFATYVHTVMMNRIGQRIVADIQNQMLRHLLGADLAFHQSNASGQLLSRVVNDVAVMRIAISDCITSFGKSTLTLVILIGVMFYQDWLLACCAFIAFPAGAWFVSRVGKRLRRVASDTQSELAHFSGQLTQMFQGMRHVKAYGMESYEGKRFGDIIERIFKFTHKGFRVGALTTPMNEIFSGVAIVTVIIYGGLQVMEGAKTPGALFSFITAFLLAYEPMKRLGKVNMQMQAGLAATDRVFYVLDTPPAVVDRPSAQPLRVSKGEVALNNASFSYATGDGDIVPALRGVSVTAHAGQTIALVGGSGAGKSTVLNLIPRFYDVTDGHVAIDGQDIRDVTIGSLRASIALVSQDIVLFDDTVRANIGYGREGATEAEIIAAAKDAQAHDFIASLPQGYDTEIGELGSKLSGGQRQRLVIARAMLKNAPILLLDEATSALDSESEKAVQAALKRLQAGRTTIVVAHRLSTIVDADRIYVLDGGRIAESGTHAELMGRRGVYFKLYGNLNSVASSSTGPAA